MLASGLHLLHLMFVRLRRLFALRRLCSISPIAAFSLVEMSIVVLIISIVAVMGLEMAANFMDRTAYKVTQDRLDKIDKALVEFRRVHNRLPCPAYYGDVLGGTCYGKEYNGSGGLGSCADTTGPCYANALTGTNDSFGHVPVRDLGLPLEAMVDGYGNRIYYVVTTNQTYNETYTPGNLTDNFANTADGIAVRSGKIDATCGGATDLCQSRGSASYFLFSVGRDKRGGFPPSVAGASVPCFSGTMDDGKIDSLNCRLNNTTQIMKNGATPVTVPTNAFYDSRFNAGSQEATHFDDIVRWRAKSQL